jgi:hypothetical protein
VLNIPTKINKGSVEITADVHLIKTGDKVGASEATLLAKLGIKPFSYGLVIQQVFDNGSLYDPKVSAAELLLHACGVEAAVCLLHSRFDLFGGCSCCTPPCLLHSTNGGEGASQRQMWQP